MLIHPQFDPVAFSLGPLAVRWYGLMYLAGFFCFWLLGRRRSSEPWRGISGEDLENLLFYGIFGVILGGRLGYCLFYQPEFYLSHPMQILHVWEGGMSSHDSLRPSAWNFVLDDFGLRCTARAARPHARAHRQLHQRRALGASR